MLNRVQKTHFPALLFNNKMRQVGQKMTVKFYYIFFASSFFFSTFIFPFLYLAFLFGMRDDKFTNVLPFSRSHLIFILFSANISFYWLPFFFACLALKWSPGWGWDWFWVRVGHGGLLAPCAVPRLCLCCGGSWLVACQLH